MLLFLSALLYLRLWSSGLSNIVSVILIYVGVLYSTYAAVDQVGGLAALVSKLPASKEWLNPFFRIAACNSHRLVCGHDYTSNYSTSGPVQIACSAKDVLQKKVLSGVLR